MTDIVEIAKHGVFSTPAVVIDGVVKSVQGPTKAEVRGWLGSDRYATSPETQRR